MSGRYDKMSHLLAFQQKSHYEHIENPRATIKIQPPTLRSHSLHYKTKTTHERDRLRKLQNKKMLFNLLEIYNGQGLLSKMEEEGKRVNEYRNKSLTRSFKKIEQEKEIRKQNKELVINIQNAEPMIGNKKDWNRHFEHHLEMEKKLCWLSNRNGQFNLSNFKTFYNQKKRRLLSEDRGTSEKQSEQMQKNEEEEVGVLLAKKEHHRKKSRKRKEKIIQNTTQIQQANTEVQKQ